MFNHMIRRRNLRYINFVIKENFVFQRMSSQRYDHMKIVVSVIYNWKSEGSN